MTPTFFPVEDNGMMIFCQEDPSLGDPTLRVNEHAHPADYPHGDFQILGRKSDDASIYRSFHDFQSCSQAGYENVPFTIVPNWEHYSQLIRRPH